MFGLLNVEKPSGLTSRDVVNRVQGLVRPTKVGHAGTLDPLADGVLLLCLGPATRLVDYLHRLPKQYLATFRLGCRSDTDDVDGHVEELPGSERPSDDRWQQLLPTYSGEIQQVPPAYSALKVGGRRAYQLARRGEAPEMKPRPVTIHELHVVRYEWPTLVLRVVCGSGTYIRALGRDLAVDAGTAAVMSGLTREAIGPFKLEEAVSLESLSVEGIAAALLPPLEALPHLPRHELTAPDLRSIIHGGLITLDGDPDAIEIAALDSRGRLVAVLAPAAGGRWRPRLNFAASQPH